MTCGLKEGVVSRLRRGVLLQGDDATNKALQQASLWLRRGIDDDDDVLLLVLLGVREAGFGGLLCCCCCCCCWLGDRSGGDSRDRTSITLLIWVGVMYSAWL